MRKFYFVFLSVLCALTGLAQTTIFSENMGTPSGTLTLAANTFQNSGSVTYSGTADVRNTTVSSGYTGASGGGNVFFTNTTGRFFQIEGINTSGFMNISLSLGHYKSTTAGNNELKIEVSEDGTNWTELTYSRSTGTGTVNWLLITPSGTIPATSNLRLRFTQTSATTQFRIDDIVITGTPGSGPVLNVSSSMTAFASVSGVASAEQTYTAGGSNLAGDISITAPAGFEISTTSGSGFQSSLVLTQTGGTVAPTTIYVRMNTASIGLQSGSIAHVSGTATQQTAVTGTVLATEPATPSTVSFSNVTPNSMEISFNGGSGASRIVVVRAATAVTATPADGTAYTDNSVFAAGAALSAGQFVVYNGSGNAVTVTGLSGSTTYHVAVYEYNDGGVAAGTNYLATAGTGSQQTGIAPEGLQVTAVNLPFVIDFDQSVANVNNGTYAGTGFTSSPAAGQLYATAWAATGWSDGPMSFGTIKTSGDYARGASTAAVTTGGFYAFEVASGNTAFGIQPGGNDWAPGTLTLKIQNQTGTTIHSLALAYKLFVRNNESRSSTFNFSYSADNTTYTDVSALDYTSPDAVDAAGWVLHNRNIDLAGLNVAPGGYFYIRWSGSDAGGTNSRDEFALDDIAVTANAIAQGPLPVRFTGIRAIEKPNGISVLWTNSTEENVVHYAVERATGSGPFEVLATVGAKWNHGGLATYDFLDAAPTPDNFYRVRALESDGTVTYSSIVRMTKGGRKEGVRIYPNPVTGNEVVMQLQDLAAGHYEILIVAASGQQVSARSWNHAGGAVTETLPIGKLKPGLYFLRVGNLNQAFIVQ